MRYLTAILFGLLAAGCGDKAADNLMTQASVLIEEHPDSALLALRQIDPSAISPAADARRRLLLAQTYSRTGAEADKDSLTAPALDYYERHGSGAERAYAWYFDAKVHHNAGDLGRAIKGYTQAMLYAERNRDKAGTTKLLMALYHTLGLLYLEQGYDTEAEEAFSKAVAAAQETGSAELEGYSRYMLSSAQYANGRYAAAIETLSPLVGARDTMAFRFFAQQITLQNLIYHTFAEDWSTGQLLEERARIDMHELWTAPLTHGPASADDDDRTLYDIASAIIFYRAEQPDSAQYYIDRSLAHIKRFNQNNIGLYTIAAGRTAKPMPVPCSTSASAIRSTRHGRGYRWPSWKRDTARPTKRRSARRGCVTESGSPRWHACCWPRPLQGRWWATGANSGTGTRS